MEPNVSSGVKMWQWIVTIVVVIALIIIGVMVFGKKSTPVEPVVDNTPAPTQTMNSANRIVMTDQYPGNVVYLSSVALEQPGFVVIHKDNAGQPGAVIGSAYFDKGIAPGKVTLTSPTVDGSTYYAVLHADDGDKKFNATKDLEMKDSSGKVIMKVFKATSEATIDIKG